MIIHWLINIPHKKLLFFNAFDYILKLFLFSRGIKAKPNKIYKVLVFTVVKLICIVTSSVSEN